MKVGDGPRPFSFIESEEMQISAKQFKAAETARNTWVVYPESGADPKEMLNPASWVHVCRKFSPGDRIEFLWEDMTLYAEGMVIQTGDLFAKVVYTMDPKKLSNQAEVDEGDGYTIRWISPPLKFGVIRDSDGERIKDGFATKGDAAAWVKSHKQAMAA